ncbi:alpha/beta hydrolase [Parenemella sanctibonifatiensis]|uniref:Alpha/beta hydrolase n=2 Tax=Parenemella sanctibonifatiensis TaxID=2016505 RepID=A0A255EAE2_9ACTN|nr:alpha/beta hydrolase [Parenemella sanctibonifatiensis]
MRLHCNTSSLGERMRTVIKRIAIGAGVVILVPVLWVGANLALLAATGTGAEVSAWKSEQGRAEFRHLYDETMALMPPPAQTWDVPTDFGSVRAYRFEKPGADETYRALPPIVLLPGHSAPVPMWHGNLPHYLPERPVIAIDLLGQPGLSEPTRPVTNEADQARWLDQALAGIGVARAHLVGVSFGGWTATNYALHHPERVASLSLFDPAYVFAPVKLSFMLAAVGTVFPLMPPGYDAWFTSYTANGADTSGVPEAAVIEAGITHYSVVQPTPAAISEAELVRLEAPVFVVFGGRSVIHDARRAQQTALRTMPHAQVELKPEGSHAVHGEYAEELDAQVVAFADLHD